MSMSASAPGPDHRPQVSVIIPVFNKLELTRACVESLHRVGARASFEIVVVDNGSSDGTGAWLAGQEQTGCLRVVRCGENLGFSGGCNAGAAAARGRYLLFLNNDMEVLENWLDPLVDTLERDPGVGIAGSRLLYADNTIQHGGVALVRYEDRGGILGGYHLGHRKPAGDASARAPQYLQAVTGACLLIRAAVFADCGGFETGYWNGNEDVHLCLEAARRGWQVVYRPESVIYHFESQSGPERWSRVQDNVTRFNEIWQQRARADFVHERGGGVRPGEARTMRPYVTPRLSLRGADATEGPMVSVIVLTWNALDYTRRCAESLLRHTDPRHELIFVDNGSRQDTLDYLADLEEGHPRVKVLRNGANLGFAAGNNVGLAAARGDYACLLNSDTVVTAGWLDALVAAAEADGRVGLVGPVTNSISGEQKLPAVPYDEDSLEGLGAFAAARAREHAGSRRQALMVVGFCLLIRRGLLERIGGLDEGFGQGNYEDTDYCLRAALAGFDTVVALDSFVHHFGSRSFADGKVDYRRQIDEKFQIFRRKWNIAEGARDSAQLNLEQLLRMGYLPALHFHPLPEAPGVGRLTVPAWERERWLDQGEAFFNNGRLAEAERIFRAVLDEDPTAATGSRAANNLACALWQSGDEESKGQAVEVLEQLLTREPGNEDARWNLQEMSAGADTSCSV